MTALNSLIIGPGAIGALVCAGIQTFSHVHVFRHREQMTLKTQLESGAHTISLNWRPDDGQSRIDVIWVCCKAMHAVKATQDALSTYPDADVVLLHNGLGPQQALSEQYGPQIIWGSTTCGALPVNSQHFLQTSFGKTRLEARAEIRNPDYFGRLFRHLSADGVLCPETTESIEQILWQKILINACVNPLTAYYGVRNGRLSAATHQQEISIIAGEVVQLMHARRLTTPEDPLALVNQVIAVSADNWSSMAQDIHHRRLTEIDYINGFLIHEGRRLGIDTPALEIWYKRIALMQNS